MTNQPQSQKPFPRFFRHKAWGPGVYIRFDGPGCGSYVGGDGQCTTTLDDATRLVASGRWIEIEINPRPPIEQPVPVASGVEQAAQHAAARIYAEQELLTEFPVDEKTLTKIIAGKFAPLFAAHAQQLEQAQAEAATWKETVHGAAEVPALHTTCNGEHQLKRKTMLMFDAETMLSLCNGTAGQAIRDELASLRDFKSAASPEHNPDPSVTAGALLLRSAEQRADKAEADAHARLGELNEIEQVAAKALDYPPGPGDRLEVGEHTPLTIVDELAAKVKVQAAEIERLREAGKWTGEQEIRSWLQGLRYHQTVQDELAPKITELYAGAFRKGREIGERTNEPAPDATELERQLAEARDETVNVSRLTGWIAMATHWRYQELRPDDLPEGAERRIAYAVWQKLGSVINECSRPGIECKAVLDAIDGMRKSIGQLPVIRTTLHEPPPGSKEVTIAVAFNGRVWDSDLMHDGSTDGLLTPLAVISRPTHAAFIKAWIPPVAPPPVVQGVVEREGA